MTLRDASGQPNCPGCGGTVIRRRRQGRNKLWCSPRCQQAARLGMGDKKRLVAYLISRDRGRCGICRKPVRAEQGEMGPSVDHMVPVTEDPGRARDLANFQLAHLRCNRSKGNRGGGEQLLLFG